MRLLRLLLRLYPREHSDRYGAEMLEMAEYAWDRAGRSRGALLREAVQLMWGAACVRSDRSGRWMMGTTRGFVLDGRFLARSLWKSRGYVATAVVVLACAVAVNATVFSYVRGTLLDTPPYPEPEDVMVVWGSARSGGQLRDVVSGPNFIDLQREITTLQPVAAFHSDGAYLLVDGRPEVLGALEVTVDFLDVLGVTPALGRFFDERDRMSGAARTVVLTHAFWRDRLASDPGVLGSALSFEGSPRTIIGVLPEDFDFIAPVSLYIPLRDDVLAGDDRGRIHYHVLGRLAPGATVEVANSEAAGIMRRIEDEHAMYEGWTFLVEPLHRVSVEAVRPVILILSVTVGLVLLVALVNLATLFRIRAFSRTAELSVRAALGARRSALVRVLVMETAGLAIVGATIGLLAAPFILGSVADMVPVWIAIPESAARVPVLRAVLDPGVAAISFGSAVLGSLLLTAPAFSAALRGSMGSGLSRTRVRGGMRSTRWLVGVELVVATVLCLGAALTARSAAQLLSEDVGLEADGLLTLNFADVWGLTEQEQVQYYRDVVEEVERLPTVRAAGVIDYVDFLAEDDFARVYFLDRNLQPRFDVREEWRRVDEGLFEAAGMTMVAGRGFEAADFVGAARAAVVNQAFAARHYGSDNPIGEVISTGNAGYVDLEIVGIVGDLRSLGPAAPPPPMLYVPNQGAPRGTQGMYVRTDGDPMASAGAVREAIWSVDSSQPIEAVQPMSELVEAWVAIPKATRALVLALAMLACALSAVGVFGVVAYTVKTRRAEMGIRLALGASPDRLEADQLRAITPVVVLGVGCGLLFGVMAARAAGAVLYGVSPADPVSLGIAVVTMASAALVATYVPARRAGRVDPTEVIRTE